MSVDLEHDEEVRETAARTSLFVQEVVLPVEDARVATSPGPVGTPYAASSRRRRDPAGC